MKLAISKNDDFNSWPRNFLCSLNTGMMKYVEIELLTFEGFQLLNVKKTQKSR